WWWSVADASEGAPEAGLNGEGPASLDTGPGNQSESRFRMLVERIPMVAVFPWSPGSPSSTWGGLGSRSGRGAARPSACSCHHLRGTSRWRASRFVKGNEEVQHEALGREVPVGHDSQRLIDTDPRDVVRSLSGYLDRVRAGAA